MGANATNRLTELLAASREAMEHAYAPYSGFKVGAALVDDQGRVFSGCNVENSSYGGTICAERNAIGAMVSAGGRQFSDIVVVTNSTDGWPPCGICRQVLLEFASDPAKVKIHVATPQKIVKTFQLSQLLPEAFGPDFLKSSR